MNPSNEQIGDLERKWTTVGAVVLITALLGLFTLFAVVALINRARIGGRAVEIWPTSSYNALEPLALYWLAVALPMLVIAALILARLVRTARAILIVGSVLLVAAVGLALRPISSYPATRETPGKGECAAVLFGSGPYGDSDEVCFDVRATRRLDVTIIAAAGLLVLALGFTVTFCRRRAIVGPAGGST